MLEVPVRIVLHPEALHERARERVRGHRERDDLAQPELLEAPARGQARAASVA